ncbi:nucleotide sugar dehydrogenase [Hypoxylon sp. FL0890]|nr:nucleotide sugar dehydrogenase [Hypoxylon sp. FL0890]
MYPVLLDDVNQEAREAFPSHELSLAMEALSLNLGVKPSQDTSPPRTPEIDNFKNGVDGRQYLRLFTSGRIDEDEEPLVAIIGCGYIGAQLIRSFSSQYDVIGFDVSKEQLRRLRKEYEGDERVIFTLDARDLANATHFLISVPTLLKADKTIDTSYVKSALMNIRRYARQGSTVVIESSVAIGMTRRLLGPLAEEKGFFAGMSPEVRSYTFEDAKFRTLTDSLKRVDPGRTDPPMKSIPKILSGLDDVIPGSLDAITRLYSRVFDTIVPVSTPETAEMTKLYENCQRMVAITYANEMADACRGHGIDPYEVCKAASTKPFGYTPFTPGLGVGGHCIPINPYYLLANNSFPLLKFATETTLQRPEKIGQRALDTLFREKSQNTNGQIRSTRNSMRNEGLYVSNKTSFEHVGQVEHIEGPSHGPSLSSDSGQADTIRPRVLVVGVGFKAGQSHLGNSPGLKLIQTLADSGRVDVMFADALVEQSAIPHIPRLEMNEWNKESLEGFDMIIVAFKQTGMDFRVLEEVEDVRIEMWCP